MEQPVEGEQDIEKEHLDFAPDVLSVHDVAAILGPTQLAQVETKEGDLTLEDRSARCFGELPDEPLACRGERIGRVVQKSAARDAVQHGGGETMSRQPRIVCSLHLIANIVPASVDQLYRAATHRELVFQTPACQARSDAVRIRYGAQARCSRFCRWQGSAQYT